MEVVQLRRHFCPLSHARQYQEVGSCPHTHPGAGSWSSSYSIPAGCQGQVRHPHLPAKRQTAEKSDKNQPNNLSQHCPGILMALGCRERPPGQSPHAPPLPLSRHGNPYSHHSMGTTSWTRARENNVTFIKNAVLSPLDPTSYLLTGVKYYYSATPSRQVFLSA